MMGVSVLGGDEVRRAALRALTAAAYAAVAVTR